MFQPNLPGRRPYAAVRRIITVWMIGSVVAIKLCLSFTKAHASEPTLSVAGKWIVLGLSNQQSMDKWHAWGCEGELAPIIAAAGAPLGSINWLHPKGCVRDWIATSHWPLRQSLGLLHRLEVAGFKHFHGLRGTKRLKDLDGNFRLSLAKRSQFSSADVWIHCADATCRIFASELQRPSTSGVNVAR